MVEWLLAQIHNNDIFNGVLGGSGIAILRYLYIILADIAYFKITRSISFNGHVYGATNFNKILKWIDGLKGDSKYKALNVYGAWNEISGRVDIQGSIGNGTHCFFYNRKLISITFSTNFSGNSPVEIITIRCYFVSDKFIDELLLSLEEFYYGEDFNCVPTFVNSGTEWKKTKGVKRKKFDRIVLKNRIKEELIDDINAFSNRRDWYIANHIQYKRGYMFYGKPGTGKTNTIIAMATHLNYGIYFLELGNVKSDMQLTELLGCVPPKTLVVIEELDCFDISRTRTEKSLKEKTLGLGSLLNTMDGILSHDDQIIVITTNHPENIDEALLRNGRIDYKVKFEEFEELEARKLYEIFYHGETMPFHIEYPISPAKLQGMIVDYSTERHH